MKKEEMKEKVMKFKEEHKKGLKVAAVTGLVILGGVAGWKGCAKYNGLKKGSLIVYDKDIIGVFKGVKADYGHKANLICGSVEEGLKMADMGVLGEKMAEAGVLEKNGLTHFIMFGEGFEP